MNMLERRHDYTLNTRPVDLVAASAQEELCRVLVRDVGRIAVTRSGNVGVAVVLVERRQQRRRQWIREGAGIKPMCLVPHRGRAGDAGVGAIWRSAGSVWIAHQNRVLRASGHIRLVRRVYREGLTGLQLIG